ncbi:MAG TPA: signal peptidase I [Tepidisphaeraceae bacterium]|nr:signal peptidase I [Tepidisphaeraceae bacterium]
MPGSSSGSSHGSPRGYVPPAPPPPAAQPQVLSRRPPTENGPAEGSVKDTIESILVAFILAFIFRAFIVEAFVIPTGSMATTLLGAHMRFRCPDCGYRFEVNYQPIDTGTDDLRIDSIARNKVYAVFCPNCGYRLPRYNPDDPANDATEPFVRYGDRILVLKYLYLLQDPQRWDVVVFKSPERPERFDYAQNYIKRLVGKPGETIMILDGDVYVADRPDPQLTDFKVQTKPRHVQQALWRIVYDNDYQPRGLNRVVTNPRGQIEETDPPWEQPWKTEPGQTGWTIGDGSPANRHFTFDNLDGAATVFFDPSANPLKHAMTDWLAYDVTVDQGPNDPDSYRRGGYAPAANVSDVKLSFYYDRQQGDGPLRVQLTKHEHVFEAVIGPEQFELLMNGQPVAGPTRLPRSSGPVHVEMQNVDYRVSVRIDDRVELATSQQQYHPDIEKLYAAFRAQRPMPQAQVRISAEKQRATLRHITLWRDVYYLNRDRNGLPLPWASPADFPRRLMVLGPDEFFVLGDNSFVSLDARYWEKEIFLPNEDLRVLPGRVPRRFMLGKAFFVYWPAGFRPFSSAPALIPNFGDMRFIH